MNLTISSCFDTNKCAVGQFKWFNFNFKFQLASCPQPGAFTKATVWVSNQKTCKNRTKFFPLLGHDEMCLWIHLSAESQSNSFQLPFKFIFYTQFASAENCRQGILQFSISPNSTNTAATSQTGCIINTAINSECLDLFNLTCTIFFTLSFEWFIKSVKIGEQIFFCTRLATATAAVVIVSISCSF